MHVYEVRPRKDHRGVDLISDALPFGRLWYGEPNAISNAIGYAMHRSRSHDAVRGGKNFFCFLDLVRPSESRAETQPKLQPRFLRLSAMISQYFTQALVVDPSGPLILPYALCKG
jgi:hypothetical protein